jgi:hypothetical protein
MTRDEIIRMARDAGSIDSEDVIETVYSAFFSATRKAALDAAPEQEPVALCDPAEYDDFQGAVSRNCAAANSPKRHAPVTMETVYETIIHWDEGGGKRSRRELARRIVALYTTPPAPSAEPVVTDDMRYRAARSLADRSADECGVDREDNWMIYGDQFLADADAALRAALGEQHGTC